MGLKTYYKEVISDMFTPMRIMTSFDKEDCFLLESVDQSKNFCKFSFFGKKPHKVIEVYNNHIKEKAFNGNEKITHTDTPIEYLLDAFYKIKLEPDPTFGDFNGGFVGQFDYEAINHMGVLRQKVKSLENQRIGLFYEIREFYVYDNHLQKLYIACTTEEPEQSARKLLDEMEQELLGLSVKKSENSQNTGSSEEFDNEFSAAEYKACVSKIQEEIEQGEAIQVVFSNKRTIKSSIAPINFYRALRYINPSPYMFYIRYKDEVLLGSSPETHLKVIDGKAILKPIAGTYPILDGDIEKTSKMLLSNEKELSEHLMLIDLARNDLYTCCLESSVNVEKAFVAEVYSHLIHIVSLVTGCLKDNIKPLELFMKTFPAGTLSGAPKVRAIEMIDKYERSPREFYGGCVGYFSYSQNLDTCITIRSARISNGLVEIRSGGGIVFDSKPDDEWAETFHKLNAVIMAYEEACKMEVYI